MESTRQQKIERLIQKDLSSIFLKYTRALSGTLISVSEVRVSPDLSIAHVYLSIFPDANASMAMEQINADMGKIRGEMGTLQRHQLRVIPELHFHLDETISKMERIDELLKQ
ncbi:MAG: 30S ribosome-binding factor RbfA [Paludibacteraceae bacterium]|jgi:ribosome-binding factor A|nr:30S ribosome-binding factor RbfA [Paludibacteraceae bacterium]